MVSSDSSTRITVSLIPKASAALDEAAERTGLSKTDIVNRALQLYNHAESLQAAGTEILTRDPASGDVTKITFY